MHPALQEAHDLHVADFPTGPDGRAPQYPVWFCYAMNLLDGEANSGCGCHWASPFGFVIEEGCSIHDEPHTGKET